MTKTQIVQVRVSSHITLAHLHDFVLCTIFNYVRGFHAYAFRRGDEPWLGPMTSSSMDMAHIPFYIQALGDDRKVKIGSLLSSVGDELTYVHDLGDWWQHKIVCTGTHSECRAVGEDVGDAYVPHRPCTRVPHCNLSRRDCGSWHRMLRCVSTRTSSCMRSAV